MTVFEAACYAAVFLILLRQCKTRNLALGKDTKQSSIWTYSDPGLAVNEDLMEWSVDRQFQCSHTLNTNIHSWWAVDLGDIYTVSSIIIFGRRDCCAFNLINFDVDVIMNPGCLCDKWATFQRGKTSHCSFQPTSSTFYNLTCPQRTVGRFVRIRNRDYNSLVLCEVEVYGQLLPNLTVPKTNAVKVCGYVGQVYTGSILESRSARGKLECVTYYTNEKFCCAAEFDASVNYRCTLRSKAETVIDTRDYFYEYQGTNSFLIN